MKEKRVEAGNFLAVKWLEFCVSTAGGMGLIPVLELRSHKPHDAVKKKKKKCSRKDNTDNKNYDDYK